jgi:hypothetical protein
MAPGSRMDEASFLSYSGPMVPGRWLQKAKR